MTITFKQLLDSQTYRYFPIPKEIKSIYPQLKDVSYIHFNKCVTNWEEAKEYVKNLSIGGFTDWRLPIFSEESPSYLITEAGGVCLSIKALTDYIKKEFDIDIYNSMFIVPYYPAFPFWTDREKISNPSEAYYLWFENTNDFGYISTKKDSYLINICVR